jgi:membrane-associated phospholipid phosphatase
VEADGRCSSMVVAATERFPLASAPYVIGSSIMVSRVLCGHGER